MSISLIKVRENLAETVNRVQYGGERIVLKRHGKDVAALVSIEDLQWLEEMDDQLDKKLAEQVMKRINSGKEKVYDWETVKKELSVRKKRK